MLPSTHITLVLLSLCVAKPALALSYSGLPFHATVVDAVSKEPVEGVVVVAVWRLELRYGEPIGPLTSTEAVTDKKGYFAMPGWGPLEVRVGTTGGLPRMGPNEPYLMLLKPGYEPGYVGGTHETDYLKDPSRNSDPIRAAVALDGRTFELSRWTASDAIYNNTLLLWRNNVPFLGCAWARTPRMTVTLIREGQRLKYLTGRNMILDPDWLSEDYEGQHCGAKKPILDEALK